MALQLSILARNAMLDAIEADLTSAGAPLMRIRAGAIPGDCSAPDGVGTLLASINLPGTPFAAAALGSKAKAGTWEDTAADGSGTATHFRLYKNGGTICVAQGTVTVTGGNGDMTVDNLVFAANQAFTITAFTLNSGNG